MFFRQFYDRSLAQASYLIGCQATGEAILVDPNRDIGQYLATAAAEGLRITHVTETHIHADFVSGSREIHAATGARMLLSAEGGPDWQYQFASADGATLLHDGDIVAVGNLRFDVLHTPGHTPEHLSFVVTDTPRAAGPMGILTGDFVFVGDVGRPDLLEKAAGVSNTMEAGARDLFHSLERFRTLPDHLQVWPGHGAGSACGKALGAVPSSTVGYEKLSNWGVAESDMHRFVDVVLDGQPEPPKYFAQMKRINKVGVPVLGLTSGQWPPLHHHTVEIVNSPISDCWIIDLRTVNEFAVAHVPGSLSIPASRSFSTWVGSIVPYDVNIVLLSPRTTNAEWSGGSEDTPSVIANARRDLSMIGLDRVTGWLYADDALQFWRGAGHTVGLFEQISPTDLVQRKQAPLAVIDVRGASEWREGHLVDAVHIPLGTLADRLSDVPDAPVLLQCQGGTRSAIAASLLQRLGKNDVVNLVGGYAAWQNAGLPVTR